MAEHVVAAMACACASASFISSGSMLTGVSPLFVRYPEIIEAAVAASTCASLVARLR
jgi:hypothetical protein